MFALAAAMLLLVNLGMRGNNDYVIAALWALIAVYVKQSASDLPRAQTAAWVALGIGAVLAVQTVVLPRRYPGGCCRIRGVHQSAGNQCPEMGAAGSIAKIQIGSLSWAHDGAPATSHQPTV